MGRLTDREAYLDLRARYVRLVEALRLSRDQNPATLEAIERIVEPEVNPRRPSIILPLGNNQASEEQARHAA